MLSDDAEGLVLSVRQNVLWDLFNEDPTGVFSQRLNRPLCIELNPNGKGADHASDVQILFDYCRLLRLECAGGDIGRDLNLMALTRLGFITMARLADSFSQAPNRTLRQVDVRLFQDFNQLTEEHYREHWPLGQYADQLRITETRLNDICRRVADIPSLRLVHDRVLQEAKRLLLFSSASVSEIAYDLGFADVSYFSRFFRRHARLAPSEWREQMQTRNP